MDHFSQPAWSRALTMAERLGPDLATYRNNTHCDGGTDETARQRLSYWRSQAPFDKAEFFTKRLAADRISEEDLLFLLAESEDHLQARRPQKPEWQYRLESWASFRQSNFEPVPAFMTIHNTAPFLLAFQPWISAGREQLRREIGGVTRKHQTAPFDISLMEEWLYQDLPPRIVGAISRTMVLELNVARLQGLLTGGTSAERFSSFLQRLQRPEVMLTFLAEYPVLARRVVEIISRWLSSSLEFLSHLCCDWNAIGAMFFSGADPGTVIGVTGGMGDLHRGGRAVRKVSFSSGTALMYKPRSLSIDVHFQELLSWLNARQPGLDFKTLQVLDGGDHGWMEFVPAHTCGSDEQISRFYERQGALLALLYALNAADFHHQNLIAAGEHPVLIDLESLFHPAFDDANAGEADLMAGHAMDESVLRTGFLPLRFWAEEGSAGIDLSGMGAEPGQPLPLPVPGWEQSGTDEMRFVRQQRTLDPGQNQPTLLDKAVNVTKYQEAIKAGFTRLYRFLMQCKAEFLRPAGPLAHFAQDEVRVILRPTIIYASLLVEASHPDVSRDALDRDCLFDRLWMEVDQFPWLAAVIRSEIAQLHAGDIPLFTTRLNSRDLWSGSGECYRDFFGTTAMEAAKNRIEHFNEEDLAKQLWFITGSLATLKIEGPEKARYEVREPAAVASLSDLRKSLISEARAVGDRLHSLVLEGRHDVTWVGLAYSLTGWALEAASLDLYNGLPGIALFLAYLGEVTCERRYTELARKAIATASRQLENKPSSLKSAGFCGGAGGMIYVLSHLGRLWKSPDWLAEANRMLDLLPPLVEADKDFDIVYGSAGCIGSLLSLHHCSPSDKTKAIIRQCGEHLVSHAQPMPTGLAWPCNFPAKQPLTGFSHGAAGISWALMKAAAITRDQSFCRIALAGVAYESSVFCPEQNNWPDFRVDAAGESSSLNGKPRPSAATWCNGAPGIGLSRLGMLSYSQDRQLMEDLDTALKITLEKGLGLNHCLCHGDLGNLELLIQATGLLQRDSLRDRLNWAASITTESIRRHGWLTGVPKGVETPGLMVGLAGIGYGLLRLAEPERVPSLVSLGLPLT
jgi:type 2 lantibiotic biosynthesis protein LanM